METPDDPSDPAAATADARALADIAAGRLIDGDTVARWLGGWQLARAPAASRILLGNAPRATIPPPPAPLYWSESGIADCDRLMRAVAVIGPGAERRIAADLVAAMIRLIVEGTAVSVGIADVPMPPLFALRVVLHQGTPTILGLRHDGVIT